MQILVSAGEASGEMYGAGLIEALQTLVGGAHPSPSPSGGSHPSALPRGGSRGRDGSTISFFGAGGERMRAAGCEIVVDARDLAVVGITEIFCHLPKILRLYKKLIRAADERRPDAAVVIDSPAFNWRVARQMRKRGVPVVYYVCPQFWAWRQGRVKLLRKYVNKALVIFPFEEKFYRDRGVDATFVGHPLADLPAPRISREAYAAEHGIDAAKAWITIMPGSRRKEVRMNLPAILEAVDRLGGGYEFLLPVARTIEAAFVAGLTGGRGGGIHLVGEALPALHHSRAGIIASGTATVEAAMMGTPFVMVYRVSPVTYALGKPRVKVPHFAMVNLIAEEEVVRELVQNDFTAANIVAELEKIIPEGEPRRRMIAQLARMKARLKQGSGDRAPAARAAEIVLEAAGKNFVIL